MPSFRRRLLLGTMMLVFVLLCIELMLQGFYYVRAGAPLFMRVYPNFWWPDESRCFGLKPDLQQDFRTHEFATRIYTNSQGIRTDASRRDIARQKPPGVYRVLFLGPSFTFGWGNDWEDAYPTLIAEELRVPGRQVELINLGTPGQGAANQLCWLQKEGFRFDPDLVVNTVYGERLSPLPAGCPELKCPHIDDSGRMYLVEPTLERRVREFLKSFGIVFYGYYLASAIRSPPDDRDSQAGREFYSEVERETAANSAELVDGYAAYIEFVKGVLGEQVQVALIHIPLSFVVHLEDRSRWSHLTEADPARSRARIEAEIAAMRSRGVPVVDTTPLLVERAPDQRLFYWLDAHLTPAGNRVVAEAALTLLQGMVEASPPKAPQPASSSSSPASSRISTSSSRAFSSLLPGEAPATR